MLSVGPPVIPVRLPHAEISPGKLRHPEARGMVTFAERLLAETRFRVPESSDHFAHLWPEALRILKSCS